MIRHPTDKVDIWYLDYCTLRYICNNWKLFLNLRSKNYEFIIAGEEVIQPQEVGTVHFSLPNRKVTQLNIANTPKCDSNLISLRQLRKSGILYHDHLDFMILKQRRSTIALAVRYKNLFIFETTLKNKTILVWEKERPIYLLSSNP